MVRGAWVLLVVVMSASCASRVEGTDESARQRQRQRTYEARIHRAFALARARRYQAVVDELAAAGSLGPGQTNGLNLLCMAYVGLQQGQRALKPCFQLMTLRRRRAALRPALINLALAYLQVGDTRRARLALRELLRQSPRDLQAHALLADADWLDRDCDHALARFGDVYRRNLGVEGATPRLPHRQQYRDACRAGRPAAIAELAALARSRPEIPSPVPTSPADFD